MSTPDKLVPFGLARQAPGSRQETRNMSGALIGLLRPRRQRPRGRRRAAEQRDDLSAS